MNSPTKNHFAKIFFLIARIKIENKNLKDKY